VLSLLTTPPTLDILANMKARLLFNRRAPVTGQAFAKLVLREISQPLPGCTRRYKYRLVIDFSGM